MLSLSYNSSLSTPIASTDTFLAIPRSEGITKQANTPRSLPYTPLALPRLLLLSSVNNLLTYNSWPTDLPTDHSSFSHPYPHCPIAFSMPSIIQQSLPKTYTRNIAHLFHRHFDLLNNRPTLCHAISATSFTFSQLPQTITHLFDTPSHPASARSLLCPNNRTPIWCARLPT